MTRASVWLHAQAKWLERTAAWPMTMATARRRIEKSGLFDERFYLDHNPDAADATDPLAHYLEAGAREGRQPHPWFDAAFYQSRYADVRGSGLNPLLHFLTIGLAEGRSPHPDFDPEGYSSANPDTLSSHLPAFSHFLRHGQLEGRPVRPLVSHEAWTRQFATLTRRDREAIASRIARFAWSPRFSVLVESDEGRRRSPEPLVDQLYPPHEVCAIKTPIVADTLHAALALAEGDYIVLLDADTFLAPESLYLFAETLQATPRAALLYADEDRVLRDGSHRAPWFKPAGLIDAARAPNAVLRPSAYRRGVLARLTFLGDSWEECAASLATNVAARVSPGRIVHIPFVLAHVHAENDEERPPRFDTGNPNVREINGVPCEAIPPRLFPPWRLDPDVTPSSGWQAPWSPDAYQDVRHHERVAELGLEAQPAEPTSARARGSVWRRSSGMLVFLREGLHVEHAERVMEALDRSVAGYPGAAIVGAVARTASGGHAVGAVDFVLDGPLAGTPCHVSTPTTLLVEGVAEVAALTSPCLMVRASFWDEAGGFDEHLGRSYGDIALCLAARRLGYSCLLVNAGDIIDTRAEYIDAPDTWPVRRRFLRKWGGFVRAGLTGCAPSY
jgi:hypothetical protein